MKLSVVIPVHNGGDSLQCCLEALAASTRPPDEVIVVDDGSTDGSGDLAQRLGARVVRLDGPPRGPAAARDRGAEIAQGDVFVFLDADVAVHPDTLARMEAYLTEQPDVVALFGSYDSDPPARGLVTRYKNLVHHYVHQHGRSEASTFWAGCGAIRREVFFAFGGFDEAYTRPSVEDIELGVRLKRAGYHIRLCPNVQVAHLKRWTFAGLLRSDIRDRAVPWTRLLLREGRLPSDLNLSLAGRVSALAAWAALACLVLGFWQPWAWAGALLGLALLLGLNSNLYCFFARRGGVGFAAGATGLHVFYLLYSSLAFGGVLAAHGGAGLATCARHLPPTQRALALLLTVTLLKGWLWSVIEPVWLGSDEDQHFGYVQEFTRQRTWPVQPPQMVTQERALLWELLRPFALSGQREPFDFSPSGSGQINALKRQLDTQAARTELVPPFWLPNFIRQHPPLYYTLLSPIHHLGAGRNALVRIAWMRLVSVLMATAAVGCAYGAARALWPDRTWFPVGVATLVSFHPLFTFFTSMITNATLELLCWAALTWLAVVVARRGMSWRRGLMLGGVVTAGLLTKSSFLAALPLVLALWGWDMLRTRGRCHWGGWTLAVLVPAALAGWWYADFFSTNGSAMVEVYRSSSAPRVSLPLLRYLRTYPWLTRYRPFLREWWGVFGSRDTFYPPRLYTTLEILTLLAFMGWGWLGLQALRRRAVSMGDRLILGIGSISTLSLIAFYTALDYRMAQSGGWFKIQGRYFLTPVVAQIAALAVGWTQFGRRWTPATLCVGMIVLNTYTLVGVIAPRYYGEQIVVRHEPAGDQTSLVPGLAVSRAFVVEGENLSRVDVWLSRSAGEATPEATLTLYEDGLAVIQIPIEARRMRTPYPTVLRFRPRLAGRHQYMVEVHGAGADVGLSEDGQLALKAYYPIPPLDMLARMSVVQPDFYTAGFIAGLGSIYLVSLGVYTWACLISGARTGFT